MIDNMDPAVSLMLQEDFPKQLEIIRHSIELGHLDKAAEYVHSVRGSAGFCKLHALEKSSEELETTLNNNQGVEHAYKVFKLEITAVLERLAKNQATKGAIK